MRGEAFSSLKLSFVKQYIHLDRSIWSLKKGRLKNMKSEKINVQFKRGESLDFESKASYI